MDKDKGRNEGGKEMSEPFPPCPVCNSTDGCHHYVELCPVCQSKLHHARMKFKNGEEGTFIFCENSDCDYKDRIKEGEKDAQVKPGEVCEVSAILAQ